MLPSGRTTMMTSDECCTRARKRASFCRTAVSASSRTFSRTARSWRTTTSPVTNAAPMATPLVGSVHPGARCRAAARRCRPPRGRAARSAAAPGAGTRPPTRRTGAGTGDTARRRPPAAGRTGGRRRRSDWRSGRPPRAARGRRSDRPRRSAAGRRGSELSARRLGSSGPRSITVVMPRITSRLTSG